MSHKPLSVRERTLVLFAVFALSLLVFSTAVFAVIPGTMTIQGRLSNSSNIPQTGQFNITFRFYAADTGGTAQWSENITVNVSRGAFNATLGTVTPINVTFDATRWLGITVSGDSEMSPRIRIASSPSAYKANATDFLEANARLLGDLDANNFNITKVKNVGINTTNATQTLSVQGQLNVTAAGQSAPALFTTIAGSVGIGTTAPVKTLDVVGVGNFTQGINISDTNLYRSAADTLATDDAFVVGSGITPKTDNSGSIGSSSKRFQSVELDTVTGLRLWNSPTDANPLGQLTGTALNFGAGGGTAVDTNLYRGSANVLATDDTFNVTVSSGISLNVSNALFVDASNKRIGINTTSPQSMLHISGAGSLLNVSNTTNSFLFVNGTSGYVGFNTTNPRSTLTVNGPLQFGSDIASNDVQIVRTAGTSRQINFTSAPATGTGLGINIQGDSGWVGPINDDTGCLGLASGETNCGLNQNSRWYAVHIGTGASTFAGSVGIGTASPSAKLDVRNSSTNLTYLGYFLNGNSEGLFIAHTGVNGNFGVTNTTVLASDFLGSNTYRPLGFVTNGSTRALIDTSGRVGINNTNPSQALSVQGVFNVTAGGQSTPALFTTIAGNVGIGTGAPVQKLDVVGVGNFTQGINSTGGAIISSGSVGIGTTTPRQTLDVVGSINATATGYFANLNVSGTANISGFKFTGDLNLTSGAKIWIGDDTNLYRFGVRNLTTDMNFSVAGIVYATQGINISAGTGNQIVFGTDTNLYRSASDTLRTDDTFIVGGAYLNATSINITTTSTSAGILFNNDVNLYRSAANILATDDNFNPGTDNNLDFGSSTNRWNDIRIGGSYYLSNDTNYITSVNNTTRFYTNNANAGVLRLDIGANTAQGSAGITSYEFIKFNAGTNNQASTDTALAATSGGGFQFNVPSGQTYGFAIANNNKVFIDSSGQVGINQTSPAAALEIQGGLRLNITQDKPTCNMGSRGTMWFTRNDTAGGDDLLWACMRNSTSATTFNWILVARGG